MILSHIVRSNSFGLVQEEERVKCGGKKFSRDPDTEFTFEKIFKGCTPRREILTDSRESSRTHKPEEATQARTDHPKPDTTTPLQPSTFVSPGKFTALLEVILPSIFRQRLADDLKRCVASVSGDTNRRCKSKVNISWGTQRITLPIIVRDGQVINLKAFLLGVQELIKCTMCGIHRNSATKKLKTGRSRLDELKVFLERFQEQTPENRLALSGWVSAICRSPHWEQLEAKMPVSEGVGSTVVIEAEVSAEIALPTVRSPQQNRTSMQFLPFLPKWLKDISVETALRNIVVRDLSTTDLKSGYIYIFWFPGQLGHVKIGRAKNPTERLKQWNEQCKRIHNFHISSYKSDLQEVAHVSRVERLIQVELKNKRKHSKCDGCGKDHQEWFEVSEREAVAVFQKWRDWIVQEPYELDRDTKTWRIKPDVKAHIGEVCIPLEPPATPPPRSHSRKSNRASRGNGRPRPIRAAL